LIFCVACFFRSGNFSFSVISAQIRSIRLYKFFSSSPNPLFLSSLKTYP
jgi:hypothetical protein